MKKRIYVDSWHKPEVLLEYDPNRIMSRAGFGNSRLSEGVDKEYQIIVGRAVFNAWAHLQEPDGLTFGHYVLNTLGELKREFSGQDPAIVSLIERVIDSSYKKVEFPVGDLNSKYDLLVLGIDFETRPYLYNIKILDLLMKGVDFVPL